jgi:hypothetical protein
MANTTFKGTVRAESGLKVTTQAASTGVYTDDFSVSSAGILTRRMPAILVDWDYISCPTPIVSTLTGAGGADGVMADGELFSMLWPNTTGQVCPAQCSVVAAHTVAASGFMVEGTIPATDTSGTVAGLNLQGDAATADNTGLEIVFGGSQFGGYGACTIGTHAMTFDATFHSVDWTDQDAVTIGFRKAQEFDTSHGGILAAASGDPGYTDFCAFGVQSADDVQIATALNDGSRTYTDSLDATAVSANHRFKISVTSGGVVTYQHIGAAVMDAGTLAAPSTTAAFTFDDGDTVVPYLIVQSTNQNSAILLKSLKITRTPGTKFTD